MNASLDPTYIPVHAVTIWTDDRQIYVAIPSKLGVPYITTFPLHEQGLSKAINLLKTRYEELPSHAKNYTVPPLPITKVATQKFKSNEEDRTAALAVLRKMGIV